MNKELKYKIKVKNLYKKLVAISGGQDSIYLIKLIENFQNKQKNNKEYQDNISYIYIDHQWRQDSYQQVMHIINYIKLLHRKIYIYQLPQTNMSEKSCRLYRYHLLTKHAAKHKINFIITGHNETDKIETFLNNFFRGSGIQGKTSLVIQSKINHDTYLLRPMLKLKRNNIYWACKKFYLPIWSDNTNYVYNFDRNRIRHELVPYLQKYFHRNITKSISLLLKNCYRDNEYIKQSITKLYLHSKHPIYIAINHNTLKTQNFVLQFKTIQLFCIHNLNLHLEQSKIIYILMDINKNKVNKSIKLKQLKIRTNKNWIYITL
uniref:tRNA(Ile)-lysidine synthase, chloroplastic n=1 Tax=Palisada sp. TaxID=1955416 RepID=A0A1Z1MRD2_9FLOR|nr:tRNA Ile-lysidine synthetase [Palisada sp.]